MKENLIEKSIQLIYQSGVSNFTVRKLAEFAGVSTRPIYYYFKDIDALFEEISFEVLKKLDEYTSKNYTENKFLNSGVGFVLFAKELPHYYSILSIKEFWPNQTFEDNKADDLMKSKANKNEIRIYNIMKTYSLGMALIASAMPEVYDLNRIIKEQEDLYQKLI